MDPFSLICFVLAVFAFAVGYYLQLPWSYPLSFLIFMSFAGVATLLALYGVYRMMQEGTGSSSVDENLILSLLRSRGRVSMADIVIEAKVAPNDATRALNRLAQLGIIRSNLIQGRTVYTLA
jgi:membrane protein implicated in regulation of membrane protease activity